LKIRVSVVDYLNSAPLAWSLLHGPLRTQFQVVAASPARCAEQLATGETHIGLIPSIEFQRIPNLKVIPHISISSLGRVRSVAVVKTREKEGIGSVVLDNSSRTSVILLKLLMKNKWGLEPEYFSHRPNINEMLRRGDAALLIGDVALGLSATNHEIWDLGEAWQEWQKLPFVFAFWACRTDAGIPDEIGSVFLEAKEWGLERRQEIARAYSDDLGLPEAGLREYLSKNIDYDLKPQHLDGLRRFYQLAHEGGYLDRERTLRFL